MNDPRKKIGLYMFRTGGTARFLLRGLTRIDDGEGVRWDFPAETCEPSETDIEAISVVDSDTPMAGKWLTAESQVHCIYAVTSSILPSARLLALKTACSICRIVARLAEALDEQSIADKEYVVEGADHAFDMMLSGDEEVFKKTFVPAVEWLISLQY